MSQDGRQGVAAAGAGPAYEHWEGWAGAHDSSCKAAEGRRDTVPKHATSVQAGSCGRRSGPCTVHHMPRAGWVGQIFARAMSPCCTSRDTHKTAIAPVMLHPSIMAGCLPRHITTVVVSHHSSAFADHGDMHAMRQASVGHVKIKASK